MPTNNNTLIKTVDKLLKTRDKLEHRAYKLTYELNTTATEDHYFDLLNVFFTPPKSALLKIGQVEKLYKFKIKKTNDKKTPHIYIVEPQWYTKVDKLTPSNYMFKDKCLYYRDSTISKPKTSDVAYSGSGMDTTWLVNPSLVKWLEKTIKKAQKFINKHKK